MTASALGLAVVDALVLAGESATYEYPGIVAVTRHPLVLNTGLHGWHYGTYDRIVTHADGTVWQDPAEDIDALSIRCSDDETDPHVIAAAIMAALDGIRPI